MLTGLPGVGPFTALVILAEIGGITRFPTARKLASRAGLTPTVRGSDRVAHYGHISNRARSGCDGCCARRRRPPSAPRSSPSATQAIACRRGKKIATTTVARKLLTRAWHLLADAEPAVPQPATAPAPEKQRS